MAGGDESAHGGTYTLLIEFDALAAVEFGALGERHLSPGWYAYTGSALGPAGFARVDRHHEVLPGVGASDCRCDGHLVFASDREVLVRAVRRTHERARG